MTPLLEIQQLTKSYPGFNLDAVSFAVEPGQVVGFIGSNGAGKTTIIKAILGIIFPDSGTISLFGQKLSPTSPLLSPLKQRIGVVFDSCDFPMDMSVEDVGRIGKASYDAWDKSAFDEFILSFGLERRKRIKSLSRGMGMKLSLAVALSHKAELLILDEATAGLDPLAREEIIDLLRQFMESEGKGILLSSHITSDLEKIADEIICIDQGHIVFDDAKDSICDLAGIAHCRQSDLELIKASKGYDVGELFYRSLPLSSELLVPNRFEFKEAFPHISCDRASLESYMELILKGEIL